jgi:hypothetical protein
VAALLAQRCCWSLLLKVLLLLLQGLLQVLAVPAGLLLQVLLRLVLWREVVC